MRRIAEDELDVDAVTQKLFNLLSSILNYQALGLVLNQGTGSVLRVDAGPNLDEAALRGYVTKLALQYGPTASA